MDRFIENTAEYQLMFAKYLKSNMDRFIDRSKLISGFAWLYLKSNMDRFIDDGFSSTSGSSQI